MISDDLRAPVTVSKTELNAATSATIEKGWKWQCGLHRGSVYVRGYQSILPANDLEQAGK